MANTATHADSKLTVTLGKISVTFNQKKAPAFVVAREGGVYGINYTTHASFNAAANSRRLRTGEIIAVESK